MGLQAGYSNGAARRIAVWEAMGQQRAAQMAAEAAKAKFEVPSTPEKVTEPIPAKVTEPTPAKVAEPTTTTPSNSNQMSTEMLDKLLSMFSDLSERLTKQEIGVDSALKYLQEGKQATESLSKDVTSLSSKSDNIGEISIEYQQEAKDANDNLTTHIGTLSTTVTKIADDLLSLNTRVDEILLAASSQEINEEPTPAPVIQTPVATQPTGTATPATQSEQTAVLDPRLAALTSVPGMLRA